VLVELYKEGSDTPEYGTSVTGADRYYIFENVPIGNYTLKATAPDHKDYIQQITVTSVGLIFDFTMKDASTPGDVNRDTNINLADVSLMLKYIAKWDVEMDTDAADVTGEGKINLGDVSLMLKYIAKWDVVLK